VIRAIGIVVAFLALPSVAAAQSPPACPPDKTMDARLTAEEAGQSSTQLVATHEVDLTVDIADRTAPVSEPPDQVVLTPEAGVQALATGSHGSTMTIFAPSAASLTITAMWRQSVDPANLDETAKCSGTHTFTLPVLAANPVRGVKQPNPGPAGGYYTFAVAPPVKRADLRPLEISVRSTGQVRFPRANERLRTMVVPMRTAEQVRYRTRLPNLAYATTPQKCKFWWLTCGPAFAHVAQLEVDNRGRPDLSGSNSILRSLARTQPARWAARFGIVVTATPGAARPQSFGYDLQVRQGGRLVARIRRAGRCVTLRRSTGIFDKCTLARSSTLLR
jgi:hypothetical protein